MPSPTHRIVPLLLPIAIAAAMATDASCQTSPARANYELARRYSSEFLRKFVHDTAVRPTWIGESELFWYRFRTTKGARYWLVDPLARTKVALFDHAALAARLSEACQTPIDAHRLDLRNLELDDSGDEMTFEVEGSRFVYRRDEDELEKKAKEESDEKSSSGSPAAQRGGSRGGGEEMTEREKEAAREERRKRLMEEWKKRLEEHGLSEEEREKKREEEERERSRSRSRRSSRGRGSAFSPDLTHYVFARRGNLYIVGRSGELPELAKPAPAAARSAAVAADAGEGGGDDGDENNGGGENGGAAADASAPKTAAAAELVFPFDVAGATQLSEDGGEDYSYGGSMEDDEAVPARVTWAKDSSAFYVTRRDSRGVAELYLVNSLAEPRPALQKYEYPMPGEEHVRRSELMVFHRDTGRLVRIEPKWQDESYVDVRWLKNGELRVLRRDRPMRNVEYGIVDPATGEFEALFGEGVKKGNLITQSVRYLEDRGQLIWWSERTGWGHYYLYGLDGALQNAITAGSFRASRIVDVDEEQGVLWFTANGREPDESVYHDHLYRVRFDGGGLKLLDAGDATHRSSLSKSRRFLVDNASRVDRLPTSVLRDGEGAVVMQLEAADLSHLEELGWRPPERFTVKAADGVTDLYGNMWKPFDFDPTRKYPLIVHVYPGPQHEGVSHTFSATGSRQELAQLGFIVIQVGHRGGTPTRSKAYGNHGYFNMRDYGLEDKKTAIEQLAARNGFIDVDRIGIYGHSGGGFMTAAALLKEPYNEFFKVGVSTAGNHDNNIYNNSWAERYHGLKEVEDKKKAGTKKTKDGETGDEKTVDAKTKNGKTGTEKVDAGKTGTEAEETAKKRFDIKVATNAELAANLKGKLLLIHGEIDNNVHPAGTMRLVDALIKANKRFDMLIIPGARHSFGRASDYAKHRTWDYFVEHLLGERHTGADIREKDGYRR